MAHVPCLSHEPPLGSCWHRKYYEDEDELLPLRGIALKPKTEGSLRRRLLSAKIHQKQDSLWTPKPLAQDRLRTQKTPAASLQTRYRPSCTPMDPYQDMTAVSSLEEESRWTAHYAAPWRQEESVFLPGSQPAYVENLHSQAKVNLKTVLRECDKLRKDGFRSSQYCPQGSTHLTSNLSDSNTQDHKEDKKSTASSSEHSLNSHWGGDTVEGCFEEDVQTVWSQTLPQVLPLPTPEERMRQQALTVPAQIVPIDITVVKGHSDFHGHSMLVPSLCDVTLALCHSQTCDSSCQTEDDGMGEVEDKVTGEEEDERLGEDESESVGEAEKETMSWSVHLTRAQIGQGLAAQKTQSFPFLSGNVSSTVMAKSLFHSLPPACPHADPRYNSSPHLPEDLPASSMCSLLPAATAPVRTPLSVLPTPNTQPAEADSTGWLSSRILSNDSLLPCHHSSASSLGDDRTSQTPSMTCSSSNQSDTSSTFTADQWEYDPLPGSPLPSSCSSPVQLMCDSCSMHSDGRLADSHSLCSMLSDGRVAPMMGLRSHSQSSIAASLVKRSVNQCHHSHRHGDSHRTRLCRSISLRKAKTPPPPPVRSHSLYNTRPDTSQTEPSYNYVEPNDNDPESCATKPEPNHNHSKISQDQSKSRQSWVEAGFRELGQGKVVAGSLSITGAPAYSTSYGDPWVLRPNRISFISASSPTITTPPHSPTPASATPTHSSTPATSTHSPTPAPATHSPTPDTPPHSPTPAPETPTHSPTPAPATPPHSPTPAPATPPHSPTPDTPTHSPTPAPATPPHSPTPAPAPPPSPAPATPPHSPTPAPATSRYLKSCFAVRGRTRPAVPERKSSLFSSASSPGSCCSCLTYNPPPPVLASPLTACSSSSPVSDPCNAPHEFSMVCITAHNVQSVQLRPITSMHEESHLQDVAHLHEGTLELKTMGTLTDTATEMHNDILREPVIPNASVLESRESGGMNGTNTQTAQLLPSVSEVTPITAEASVCSSWSTAKPVPAAPLHNQPLPQHILQCQWHSLDSDSARPLDTEVDSDSARPMDTEVDSDSARPLDTEVDSDSARPLDTEVDSDSARPLDTQVDSGSARPLDTEVDSDSARPLDTEVDSDSARPLDTEVDSDSARPLDTEVDSDSARPLDTEVDSDSARPLDTEVDSDSARPLDTEVDSDSEGSPLLGFSTDSLSSELSTGSLVELIIQEPELLLPPPNLPFYRETATGREEDASSGTESVSSKEEEKGDVFEDMLEDLLTPTPARSTEDLFAAIHSTSLSMKAVTLQY
ncbi:hypothetical protein JZ751_018825 [Albula glossodonta]|uniref:NHS-like protein 1 n=1 Tax=Albula glossodonta TaxID=121402 RepID=A0A8T2N1J7_9TELE|nr:hypothetical protein JZ751_018825 [Albula glossodonta]